MIKITSEDFSEAYKLLDNSFISEELKEYPRLFEEFIFSGLEIFALKDSERITAVITCWEFEGFVFIENFAVSAEKRGKGLGTQLINEVFEHYSGKVLILEVEKPLDETQQRRIRFYENLGFTFTDFTYKQPQLRDIPTDVDLYIMYKGNEEIVSQLDSFKAQIFGKVYNLSEK